tara:strand:- start:991 stop:1230 length:240 start_codon:yes stop_codon:yes gene_type:complete
LILAVFSPKILQMPPEMIASASPCGPGHPRLDGRALKTVQREQAPIIQSKKPPRTIHRLGFRYLQVLRLQSNGIDIDKS